MGDRVVRRKILSWCAGLGLCLACASPPRAVRSSEAATPPPAPTAVAVAQGESIETAVVVPEKTEPEGVDWENDWIWRHYGRFRKKSVGLATLSGRRFDVVTVELADHSERTVYFDITNFFGKR
jgi:hypothetical protein